MGEPYFQDRITGEYSPLFILLLPRTSAKFRLVKIQKYQKGAPILKRAPSQLNSSQWLAVILLRTGIISDSYPIKGDEKHLQQLSAPNPS